MLTVGVEVQTSEAMAQDIQTRHLCDAYLLQPIFEDHVSTPADTACPSGSTV